MMTSRLMRAVGALFVIVLALGSCSDSGLLSNETQFSRIVLTPAPGEIEEGARAPVAVVGVAVGGHQIQLSPSRFGIRWTSSDPSVMEIEGSGNVVMLKGIAPGRANVSVEVTPLSSDAPVTSFQVASEVVTKPIPVDFTLESSNNLDGMVGAVLPESVTVRVLDRRGQGVSGITVDFEVIEGEGQVSNATTVTNVAGYARTTWRLGRPGPNRLRSRPRRPERHVDINANGRTAQPAEVRMAGGNAQQGVAGTNLPNRISVRVVDATSVPIPGVSVQWKVLTGGGAITPTTAPTDDQGVSAVYWALGPTAGPQTAQANVGSLTANFAATAQAGPAAQLLKMAGDGQSAAVATRLSDSLVVRVNDVNGNPVSGAAVSWSVQSGGGSVSPGTTTTNAAGLARAAWTMGTAAGPASARATVAGVGQANFTATATSTGGTPPPPPPANTIVKLAGDAQSATVATRLADSIAVRVQNAQGVGVSGVTVTFAVTSGSGSVSPQTRVTNSSGVARTAWTMGAAAGPAGLRASATGAGEVNFTATATPSTGGSGQLTITKVSGDTQSGTTSTRLADSLIVRVTNAQGAGVSGQVVSWTVLSGGGSVSPASFTTNGSGFARTAWTLGSNTGSGSVRASVTNATPVTFTSTAAPSPPAVAQVVLTPAVDTINTVGGQVTLTATARNASGQTVSGVSFNWTSLNPSIATVDNMGRVTANAAGRALIVATAVCCSRADTSAIDVILAAGAPGSVAVTTSNVNADTFQVTARWGRASNAARYNWSSGVNTGGWSRTGQATDTSAVFRAPRMSSNNYWFCVVGVNSAGTSGSENACNGFVAPATGGGSPAPVATITVAPTNPSVNVGSTVQLTATLRDANNNVLTGRTVSWSSSNSNNVSVNASSGLATGVAAGQATITATSEGRTGTTTVTATAGAVTISNITVSPGTITLQPGQTQQFSAVATMSNGSTQNNPSVTWTATGGTISTAGMYTAGSNTGTFRAIASASGRADTATITIVAASPPPQQGQNHMFFNSTEPGCGTDSNVLMCDDFEDGDWYSKHCDAANSSGGLLQTDGWCGTIYANPITPTGAAECGPGVTPFGQCAATSGMLTGSVGNRNMADHSFPNNQEVQDIYIRWYYKPSVGFSWSGQKVLSVNRCCAGAGGIYWAGLGYNIGAGAPSTSPPRIGITNNRGSNVIYGLNVSNYSPAGGRWSFYEVRIKLNTPGQSDGIFEFWANDCGSSQCTGSPTLRARHTNINWGKTASNGGIGSLWFENWANAGNNRGSSGQEWYDRIKVSRVGPIGF